MSTRNGVNIPIGANLEPFKKAMVNLQSQLTQIQGKLDAATSSLRANVTLPLAAIGGAGTMMAANVEAALIKINTLVGTSGQEFAAMRAHIDKVSEASGLAKQMIAEAAFVIQSAGVKGAESMELLAASAKASAIGLGEQQALARAGTAMMQAYGKENMSAARSMDLLTAVVRAGNMEASELAPAIGKVLPMAAALGISFEEVGANIAVFTRLGVSASESVTALRAALASMLKPTKEAQEELAKYGMSFDQLRRRIQEEGLAAVMQNLIALTNGNVESLGRIIPAVEGFTNVLGTAGAQGAAYSAELQNIRNSTGMVDEGFKTASQGGLLQFNQSLNTLKNAAIEIGNILMPMMVKVAEVVRNAVQQFIGLSESKKQLIVQVGLLAASLPLITGALSTMISVMQGMYFVVTSSVIPAISKFAGAVKLGSPLALGMIGLAAVVAAVVIYWDEFKQGVERATTALSNYVKENDLARAGVKLLAGAHIAISEYISLTIKQFVVLAKAVHDFNKSLFSGDFSDFAEKMSKHADTLVDDWVNAKNTIVAEVRKMSDDIDKNGTPIITGQQLQDGVDSIKNKLTGLVDWINGLFTNGSPIAAIESQVQEATVAFAMLGQEGETAMQRLQQTLTGMKPAFAEFNGELEAATQDARLYIGQLQTELEDMTRQMMEDIAAATAMSIGQIIGGGPDNLLQGLGNMFAQFLEYLGRWAIQASKLIEGIKASLMALKGPGLLVAGIGALMLAGAIRGSLNRKLHDNVPALADGGLAYGPTMALVGEYGNAGANPEVIAPLSKLKGMLQDVGGGGRMHTRLRGADIYLSNDRYSHEYNRTTGRYLG